ncbi:MAG: metalloregulator ArsR/SmtB family transcription factor [Bacteroidota bacterium]
MAFRTNLDFLETSTETLRAIAHPIRLAIVELLHTKNEMSVTEVFTSLDIQQAVASHHLRIMKSKNIVKVSRQGQNSIYSLADPAVYDILPILEKLLS